jgi:hypothetical protein
VAGAGWRRPGRSCGVGLCCATLAGRAEWIRPCPCWHSWALLPLTAAERENRASCHTPAHRDLAYTPRDALMWPWTAAEFRTMLLTLVQSRHCMIFFIHRAQCLCRVFVSFVRATHSHAHESYKSQLAEVSVGLLTRIHTSSTLPACRQRAISTARRRRA